MALTTENHNNYDIDIVVLMEKSFEAKFNIAENNLFDVIALKSTKSQFPHES